jgi:hypothetical protein
MTIFKVNKDIFGALLAISRPGSALFSHSGLFMSHGFREISVREATLEFPRGDYCDVDEIGVRLFKHPGGSFRANSTHADVDECAWARTQ